MIPIIMALAAVISDPSQAAAAEPSAKPKLICREGEQQTGSHVRSGRKCQTQEQWDREDALLTQRPVTMRVIGEKSDGGAQLQPH
jgi:hypothetical protein